MALVYHEIVEAWLERRRLPQLGHVPTRAVPLHSQPGHTAPPGDEQLAIGDRMRLQHRLGPTALRSMLPQQFARFDSDRMQAKVVIDQDLPLASEGDKLRRTITPFAHPSAPHQLAIISAISREAAVTF